MTRPFNSKKSLGLHLNDRGEYELSPEDFAACSEYLDYLATLTPQELAIVCNESRQRELDSERRAALKRRAATIKRIEKDTGKTVTGVTVAADGSVTSVTFGEPSPSETPSTADDELARWRRKHAR